MNLVRLVASEELNLLLDYIFISAQEVNCLKTEENENRCNIYFFLSFQLLVHFIAVLKRFIFELLNENLDFFKHFFQVLGCFIR